MRSQSACVGLSTLCLFVLIDGLSAQNGPSVWDLNGSQLYLIAIGAQREFRYHTMRPGLEEAGAQAGTLWFLGTRSGDQYSGTAYVFSKTCGAFPYAVTGSASNNNQTITLNGSVPIVAGDSCAIVDHREGTDVLRLLETTVLPDGQIQTYGEDGRLFSSGNDEYFILSRMAKSDDEAPGYIGQVRVVHHFPGSGYEILMKDYAVTCTTEENPATVNWFKAGDHSAPVNVPIEQTNNAPKPEIKESYNLYWAACHERFQRFK
jgi:hypothetical protein